MESFSGFSVRLNMCFREMFVVIHGASLKLFGFRLDQYLSGRLVGMEVLQEK